MELWLSHDGDGIERFTAGWIHFWHGEITTAVEYLIPASAAPGVGYPDTSRMFLAFSAATLRDSDVLATAELGVARMPDVDTHGVRAILARAVTAVREMRRVAYRHVCSAGKGEHMVEELVTVYDAEGNVTGTAPRSRVYAEGLWHGSAGVLLRSSDGERIYVHRRTPTKAVFAGMHDCLAGGVIDPGETPLQTATRELHEELGITGVPLTPLASAAWDGQWAGKPMRCHVFAFETHCDGPIRHQPEEISAGWWWTDDELAARLTDPDWPFVPDTRVLIPQLLRLRQHP